MTPQPRYTDLCHALQQGQLCCIFGLHPDDQQALRQQTSDEMRARGYRSMSINLSALTNRANAKQGWAKHLITALWHSFYPTNRLRLSQWMKTTAALSTKDRLIQFTNDLLLSELCESPVTILIDNIDVLRNLPSALSDLFTWIDYCYELRDTYLSYHHLSFAVFGTQTPTYLGWPVTAVAKRQVKTFLCAYRNPAYSLRYEPIRQNHITALRMRTID